MQSTARPKALIGELPRPPSLREGDRRSGGRSKRIARPSTFRALSKSLIQLRVQGRNPARFKGGYGVPRGFKGEKSKFPPNPLGLAERVPSSADDDSPFPKRQQYNPQLQMHLMVAISRNPVMVTNSFHRLRAVPLPRGGRSGGAGKIESNPNHMSDMRRVRRAYDFFCFRRIGVSRPNWPNGGFSAQMTCPRPSADGQIVV